MGVMDVIMFYCVLYLWLSYVKDLLDINYCLRLMDKTGFVEEIKTITNCYPSLSIIILDIIFIILLPLCLYRWI